MYNVLPDNQGIISGSLAALCVVLIVPATCKFSDILRVQKPLGSLWPAKELFDRFCGWDDRI